MTAVSDAFSVVRTVAAQVRLFDLMPTLLELAGIAPPPSAARSLLPALVAPAAEIEERPALSVGKKADSLALRQEGWKYIRYPPLRGELLEALYDLAADPGESVDLAAAEPEMLERMRRGVAEQLLAHGTGRLVMVRADGSARYRLRLRWNREAELGLLPQPGLRPIGEAEDATWEYTLEPSGPRVFVAPFLTSDDAALEVTVEREDGPAERRQIRPDTMVPYRAGLLEELSAEPGLEVRVFAGRDPVPLDAASTAPIDARQVETLRALGYIQ